jgi:beta-1,4-mannosyltransferase
MSGGIAHGEGNARRAVVIVQGDLGRSPRMQYHAFALAVNGLQVDFVGMAGSGLPAALRDRANLAVHAIDDLPAAEPGPWVTLRAAARAFRQAVRFRSALRRIGEADIVLVQTPPSVPAAILGWRLARRRRARFVLDWHNLGWTLFALKAGRRGTALLRAIEHWIGRRADAHLAVSRAMAAGVLEATGGRAAVVYDRAPDWFGSPDADRCRRVRARLFAQSGVADANGAVLVVSPTSYTADESLDLLIDAADLIEAQRAVLPKGFPRMLVLATGAGPGRGAFEARAAARPRDAFVTVRTAWVEADDYPALLACADAGVCTHDSSSGLDLPMKIADMFGVGLPVVALAYPALAERLRDGENGALFTGADGLARAWRTLFAPSGAEALAALRRASAAAGQDRWLDGWNRDAKPILI